MKRDMSVFRCPKCTANQGFILVFREEGDHKFQCKVCHTLFDESPTTGLRYKKDQSTEQDIVEKDAESRHVRKKITFR